MHRVTDRLITVYSEIRRTETDECIGKAPSFRGGGKAKTGRELKDGLLRRRLCG